MSAERSLGSNSAVLDGAPNIRTDQELFNAYRDAILKLDHAIKGQPVEQEIIDSALEAFARSFKDLHTYFLSKSRWEAHQTGSFYSYGLLAERIGDSAVITDVMPDSVAMNAGVRPGDVVISQPTLDDPCEDVRCSVPIRCDPPPWRR